MALILERSLHESIIINDNIKITVTLLDRRRVKLCIDAPAEISINREEVFNRIVDKRSLMQPSPASPSLVKRFFSK